MKRFLRVLAFVASFGFLFGCGTSTVIGGCPIPARYDYTANGPKTDMAEVDTNPSDFIAQDAKDRHDHAVLAGDYNGFRNYVETQCQHDVK
jgi:hypothetical protein